jgi:predicted GH43/DUF377 family glycosyl hydrolase
VAPAAPSRLPIRIASALLGASLTLSACGGSSASASPRTPGATDASPAASMDPAAGSLQFTFSNPQPAVSPELTGIDEAFINPGAVIEQDGTLHMFANAFTAWPGFVQVPHLTSTDGMAWTLAKTEPLFTSDDTGFDTAGADVSTGFVTDDGTWVLIFETTDSSKPWLLGRATAPAPDGPWTFDPDPILEPGTAGSWDAGGLSWPSVVRTDGGYAMYYTATDKPRGVGVIGMATSPDGATWTKRDAPVLTAAAPWEHGSLDRPRVARTNGGFVMVYAGADLTDRGVARSSDGVTWTRDGEQPAITQDDFPVDGRCWDAALVNRDGTLYYYLEIGGGTAALGTDIFLATASLP